MTGLLLVAVGGPVLILGVSAFDVVCLLLQRPTPGQVIQWWARDHPFLATLLAGFVGAFTAHIFWHLQTP
jgi:hypothetical protein